MANKAKPAPAPALRYIGAGAALPDVPARDLSPAEAGCYDVAALLRSGLYEVAPAPAPETTEDADGSRT